MALTHTHTVVSLDVSIDTHNEIEIKLRNAGYAHCFLEDGLIDMTGIGLVIDQESQPTEHTTTHEKHVLYHLAEAWNEFIKLRRQHPNDTDEFMRAIHSAQAIIALRTARHADPDTWPTRL